MLIPSNYLEVRPYDTESYNACKLPTSLKAICALMPMVVIPGAFKDLTLEPRRYVLRYLVWLAGKDDPRLSFNASYVLQAVSISDKAVDDNAENLVKIVTNVRFSMLIFECNALSQFLEVLKGPRDGLRGAVAWDTDNPTPVKKRKPSEGGASVGLTAGSSTSTGRGLPTDELCFFMPVLLVDVSFAPRCCKRRELCLLMEKL